jgi:hypothetical protein
MVFGAMFSKWRYYMALVFFTGVTKENVSENTYVFPTVTLRGQNYSFSHSPRENLFNFIPDNDARMLALCKLCSAKKMNDKATYKPTLRPETSLSDLERALSGRLRLCIGYTFKFWARFNTFKQYFLVLLVK